MNHPTRSKTSRVMESEVSEWGLAKMLAQAVADAAALTAANVQAIGMNEMADLNAEIKKLREDLENDLWEGSQDGFVPTQGQATFDYYAPQIEYARELQRHRDWAQAAHARSEPWRRWEPPEREGSIRSRTPRCVYPGGGCVRDRPDHR